MTAFFRFKLPQKSRSKQQHIFQILKNDFKDIGYIGIAVDYNDQPGSKLATENVLVRNNTLRGCGVVNMFQVSYFSNVSVEKFTVFFEHQFLFYNIMMADCSLLVLIFYQTVRQPSCIHVRGAKNIRVSWNGVQKTSYAGIRVCVI